MTDFNLDALRNAAELQRKAMLYDTAWMEDLNDLADVEFYEVVKELPLTAVVGHIESQAAEIERLQQGYLNSPHFTAHSEKVTRLQSELAEARATICKYEGHLPISDSEGNTYCELCEQKIGESE